jgi:hypothetical protein
MIRLRFKEPKAYRVAGLQDTVIHFGCAMHTLSLLPALFSWSETAANAKITLRKSIDIRSLKLGFHNKNVQSENLYQLVRSS